MINEIINGENLEATVTGILKDMHVNGPITPLSLEKLSYIKSYHSDFFKAYEGKLLSLMGLFYKKNPPQSMLEEVYSLYAESILQETGNNFTPVQASAYKQIRDRTYFSFSAPTSAGKSFLFRSLIRETRGDIVIVVPSRALISEYMHTVMSLVDKSVLVMQFIDNINTANTSRRVFIITPERGPELFKRIDEFNIELFLLDEAQISEEPIRGMKFDSFVRRIDRVLPNAKKVFAHPFVKNPEAQLKKHAFEKNASSANYNQLAVGKMYLVNESNRFKYFSPNVDCPEVALEGDPVSEILSRNGTLLIYISKNKIYESRHILEFGKYIDLCSKLIDPKANQLIESLRVFIGAATEETDKHSLMISMMERGIVIHHGSMPLKARLIIEEFIKLNFAKICFATSTLNQGINMPFDLVWIDNFYDMTPLNLKNLIGRAGRTTQLKNSLDYGYVIIKRESMVSFKSRYLQNYSISEVSGLDRSLTDVPQDLKDIVEAIQTDSFNDELHLTNSQVERLREADTDIEIQLLLDKMLIDNSPITAKAYYELSDYFRKKLKDALKKIYIQHLRRKQLTKPELSVLSAAIPIMLWHIQGKSFSEIVSLRYAFLGDKDAQRDILRRHKSREISAEDAAAAIKRIFIRYTPIPSPLPDQMLRALPLYPENTSVQYLDYDTVVYDTYDFLDKVISFSIVDPICAALELYFQRSGDARARILKNYVRYGTNDDLEIWLLRYGFGFEEIEWLKPYIKKIDSARIEFHENLNELSEERKLVIQRYI